MSAFLSFRCLVTAKLLAAVLLAAAPIDASRAANLLINGKTGKCLTIAGGTSPANNLRAVQFDCDDDEDKFVAKTGVRRRAAHNRRIPPSVGVRRAVGVASASKSLARKREGARNAPSNRKPQRATAIA